MIDDDFFRLFVSADQVKSVYLAAVRLRMDTAARECANFLLSNIDVESCLELRSLPGIARMCDFVEKVDHFIDDNMDAILKTRKLTLLDRLVMTFP